MPQQLRQGAPSGEAVPELSAVQWIILVAGTGAAAAFAYWLYLRREVAVGGRSALAATRAGTFALILLLLLDPSIPTQPGSRRDGGTWVALDLSLSMNAGVAGGARPWDKA